jgi:hypothetical protein
MKSFRLDGDSVAWFLDSWPALLIGGLLTGVLVYVGMRHPWGRVAGVLFCGAYGGYALRGVATKGLRKQYPNARWHWLLSIGLATATLGVFTRMAFPEVQCSSFDLAWLGVSFGTILAFVIANRHDPDVVR